MRILFEKIKAYKIFNFKGIKQIKDFIYFKIISPNQEAKTDKYRKEIMNIMYTVFENKKWILSCGSFLRFYRDKTMEKQDLDILVDANDFSTVKGNFIKYGFRIKACFFDKEGNITEYKYVYKNVEVDIFMMRKDENNKYFIVSTMEDKKPNLKINKEVLEEYIVVTGEDYKSWKRYINNFEEIKTYEFNKFKFYGPKNPEQHIQDIYGENWRIYDPNYDPRYAPTNNMPIPSDNAKAVIYLNPRESQLEQI